jgi:type IV secretory pathway VirB10-like protein
VSPARPAKEEPGAPPKEAARSVLQAPRRPITRYRPAVIVGGLVAVLLLVGIGFMIAFGGGHKPAKSAGQDVASAPPAEALPPIDDRLPASYGELGPPPQAGGAGSPTTGAAAANGGGVGAASGQGASTPGGASGDTALAAARQQRQAEGRAAQAAGPFFGGAAGAMGQAPAPHAAVGAETGAWTAPVTVSSADAPAGAKEGFIARAGRPSAAYGPGLPLAPLSPYELKAGSTIAAALITGLNSDLPGLVVAQVTEPVFDHATGRVVLIPQGARLIGKYDSQVGYGQNRLLLVWTRLIYPSGRSVELGAMIAADATGASGLADKVDTHLPVLARAIGLSTLISIGGTAAQIGLSRGSDNLVLQDGAGGIAAQASQTGQRLVERDLQRSPTLRVRPGFRVRVMVDKDLILPPEVEARR